MAYLYQIKRAQREQEKSQMAAAATAAQTYRTHDGLTVDGSTGIILAYPGAINPPLYQMTLADRAAIAASIDADLAAYGHDLQDEAAF